MSERRPEMHERRILGTELLWSFGVGVLIAATLSMIVFTALTMGINPPSNVERVERALAEFERINPPAPEPTGDF